MRELLEDPVSALSPLEPSERVIWMGGPTGHPSVIGAFRFGCLGFVFGGPITLASIGLFLMIAEMADLRQREVVPVLVTIPLLFTAFWIVLSLVARRARRYVVTNRRVAVVDPAGAFTFGIDLSETDVRGRDVRFGVERPRVVATGSALWRLVRPYPYARLRDLEDAEGLLAEIQRACAPSEKPLDQA